jgi:membrane protein implicated in regulation of membrane protease activity
MRIDIRLLIGMLLTAAGMLLTAYGALAHPALYMTPPKTNVSLQGGLVLLAVGTVIWFLRHYRIHSQRGPVDVESMHY